MNSRFTCWFPFPEECVFLSIFHQISFIRSPCFTQGSDVDSETIQFAGYKRCSSFRSVGIPVVEESPYIPGCNSQRDSFLCFLRFATAMMGVIPRARLPRQMNEAQAIFREPFLSPSSCEVSSADPKKACLVMPAAAEHSHCATCEQNDLLTDTARVQSLS